MKIWFISQVAHMPEDGSHIRHYTLAKYLAKKGHTPIVFAGNEMHQNSRRIDTNKNGFVVKQNEGVTFVYINTHHYDKNDIHRVINILSFKSVFKKRYKEWVKMFGAPEVVYASTLYPTAITLGLKLANEYGVKCISETRDFFPECFPSIKVINNGGIGEKICKNYMRRLYEKSDKLVNTVSNGEQYFIDNKWNVEQGGKIDMKNVYYINNGVDLDAFIYNKTHNIYQDEDLDNDKIFKVVYFGAIRFLNKMPLYIETAKDLKKRGRNEIKLLLWGSGPKLDEVKELVKAEGLTNIVFKGYADKKYIASIASRADMFLCTGNGSSAGQYGISHNKVFDCFAAGKPLLLPYKVANSFIEAEGAGIELDDAGASELAEGIIKFADMNKEQYGRYCQNSQRMASVFDYKKLTETLEKVLID